jgi:hypothetical protein
VRIGFLAEEVVALANDGDGPLALGALAVQGPVEIAANSCSGTTLAAGARCTLTVRFAPTAEGPLRASLTVPNDGAGGAQTIALDGEGLAPAAVVGGGSTGGAGAASPRTAARGPAALSVTLPAKASVVPGKTVRVKVEVRNGGDTAASGATLQLRLGPSLRVLGHPRSKHRLVRTEMLGVGPLDPGATRTVTLPLHALPQARHGLASYSAMVSGPGFAAAKTTGRLRIR